MEERILNIIKALEVAGISVYPARFKRTHLSVEAASCGAPLNVGERLEDTAMTLAGRVMQIRLMGKSCFFHLQDGAGKIQGYLRKDDLGEKFQLFVDAVGLGDWVGIEGFPFKTKTGEST